jgi:hypothetical protein
MLTRAEALARASSRRSCPTLGDTSAVVFAAAVILDSSKATPRRGSNGEQRCRVFMPWARSQSEPLDERLRNAEQQDVLVPCKAIRLGLGFANCLARLGRHGDLRRSSPGRCRVRPANSWPEHVRRVCASSLRVAHCRLLGEGRAARLAVGWQVTVSPNPFIERTTYGLRPPVSAHVQRWAS